MSLLNFTLRSRKVRGRYRGSKGRRFFSPYYGRDNATKIRYCRPAS